MKTLMTAALLFSSLSFAAAPQPAAVPAGHPRAMEAAAPAGAWADEFGPEHREEREKRMRMMLVVGVADALGLNEVDALHLADKIKAFDEKRRPLREQMGESMKTLKAAADGETSAMAQVDVAIQRVLDGRAQMAVIDKEMFFAVSKDLTPQKRAQLAIFLAQFQREMKGGPGGFKGGHKGRHHQQR